MTTEQKLKELKIINEKIEEIEENLEQLQIEKPFALEIDENDKETRSILITHYENRREKIINTAKELMK